MKYLQVKHLFYEIDFSQRDIFSVSSAIKKNVSKETLQSSYQYILLLANLKSDAISVAASASKKDQLLRYYCTLPNVAWVRHKMAVVGRMI